MAFGPSVDDPHGHGGFVSSLNGACLSGGPLPDGVQVDVQSPSSGGRKRARDEAKVKAGVLDSSDVQTNRMLEALEKANAFSQERMRREEARAKVAEALVAVQNVDRQISTIKAMLEESGDLVDEEEQNDLRKQLLALCRKSLSMAAAGGSGV